MKKQLKRCKISEDRRPLQAIVEDVLGVQPWSISQSNLDKRMQEFKDTQTPDLSEAEGLLYEKILSLLHVNIGFSATQWHRAKGENQLVPATPPLISREQFYLQNLQHLTWSVGSAKQKPSSVAGRDRYTILRLPLQDPKTIDAFAGAWLSPNLVHVANQQECGSIRFARCDCDPSYRQIQYCGTYQVGEKICSEIESKFTLVISNNFPETRNETIRRQRFEDQVISIEHLPQFLALTVILELRYIGGHYQDDILREVDNENLICELIDVLLHDDYFQLHSPGTFPLEPIFGIANIQSIDLRFEAFLYNLTTEALDQFQTLCNEFSFGYDFNDKIICRAIKEDNDYFIKKLFKLGLPANLFMSNENSIEYASLMYHAITMKAIKTLRLIASMNSSYFHSDFQRAPGQLLFDLIDYKILDDIIAMGLESPRLSNIQYDLRYNFTSNAGYHPLIKSAQLDSYAFEHILSRTKMTPQLGGMVICELIRNFSVKHSSVLQLLNTIEKLLRMGADPNTHYWFPIKESKVDSFTHEQLGYTPLHMALEAACLQQTDIKALFELLLRNKADPYETSSFHIHNGEVGNPLSLWNLTDEMSDWGRDLLGELGLQEPACSPQNAIPGELSVHLVVRLKEAESCRFLMAFCHEHRLSVNQELQLPNAYFGVMDQKNTRNTAKWICFKYHLNTLYSALMQQTLTLQEIASIDSGRFRRDVFFLIDIEQHHLTQTNLQRFYSLNELMDQSLYRVANNELKLLSYLQNPHYIPGQNEMGEFITEHLKYRDNLQCLENIFQGYANTYPLYSTELYHHLKINTDIEGFPQFRLIILYYQHLSQVLSKHALTKLLAYTTISKNQSEIRHYLTVLGLDEIAYFLMDKSGHHLRALFESNESLEFYHYPALERMLNYLCCKIQLERKKYRHPNVYKTMHPLLNQLKMLNTEIIQSGLDKEKKITLCSMIIEILMHYDTHGNEIWLITQTLSKLHTDSGLIALQQSVLLTDQLGENKFTRNSSVRASTLARNHFINTEKPRLKRYASGELIDNNESNTSRDLHESN